MEQSTEILVGMDLSKEILVGMDLSKGSVIAVAIERNGDVRYVGEVVRRSKACVALIERVTAKHAQAHFCYVAGAQAMV